MLRTSRGADPSSTLLQFATPLSAFQALCVALSLDVHMNAELLKQQQGTMSGGSTTPMSQSEGGRSADVA